MLTAVVTVVALVAAVPALAQATSIKEFTIPSGAKPGAVTTGPDGSVWFTEDTPIGIGRIAPDGTITEFLKTNTQGFTSNGHPADITLGPDGNIWFTATGSPPNAIGRITPAGVVTEFLADGAVGHLHLGSAPSSLTVGADGNLWFADNTSPDSIGKITAGGAVIEYQLADTTNSNVEDMTLGPDGNVWFTDRGNTKSIGRITPSGTITETTSGLDQMNSMPNGITVGGDGRLWFTDEGTLTMSGTGGIGSASTAAIPTVTESPNNIQSGGRPDAITTGPDGTVWFEDNLGGNEAIGRISMPSGSVTEFKTGLAKAVQDDITAGADGNIWIEQSMPGGIARITPNGTITEFTSGLLPNAGADGDGFTTGGDGNLWFNDGGAKAIGKVSLELPATATTGAAGAITPTSATVAGTVEPFGAPTAVTFRYGTTPALGSTASAGTLTPSTDTSPVSASLTGLPSNTTIYYEVAADNGSGVATGAVKTFKTAVTPPPPITTTSAKFGNQQITLTTPSLQICTASRSKLSATLTSTAIKGSRAAKLRFSSAAFYIDRGVKHTRKRVRHLSHGRKKTVTITVYTANATVHRVPATVSLRLTGLKSGTHTLKVVVSYKQTVTRHGHHKTVTVTKTVTARFRVC